MPKVKSNTMRRLKREIEWLKEGIKDGEDELKFSPYIKDRPGIKADLAKWKADLMEAQRELQSEKMAARMRRDHLARARVRVAANKAKLGYVPRAEAAARGIL
jgi:hypothetical protein